MDFKSDLRSTSRDHHRAAAHKAKWAHGSKPAAAGRATSHPRPVRTSDFAQRRLQRERERERAAKPAAAVAADVEPQVLRGLRAARKAGRLPPGNNSAESESSGVDDDDGEADAAWADDGGPRGAADGGGGGAPASGSQVLNGALARAVVAFEDRETVRLVRTEWSVLDDEGEEVGLSPAGKTGKRRAAEEDIEAGYEMV